MTTLFDKFKEAKKADNNEYYNTISVRTPVELTAMVETVSIATQVAVMNMFTDDLSAYLSEYLIEDARNIELIDVVLKEAHKEYGSKLSNVVKESSIGLLEDQEIMQVSGYSTFMFKDI